MTPAIPQSFQPFQRFNSKLVRLKEAINTALVPQCNTRFNSKLVRLKDASETERGIAELGFNSKLVRLKVLQYLPLGNSGNASFNSKLVRLKGKQLSHFNLPF